MKIVWFCDNFHTSGYATLQSLQSTKLWRAVKQKYCFKFHTKSHVQETGGETTDPVLISHRIHCERLVEWKCQNQWADKTGDY